MKANIFRKAQKWFRYRKATKSIEQAEVNYMEALKAYGLLKQEWRVGRFVAYNFPGWHIHRNPVSRKVSINNPPFA